LNEYIFYYSDIPELPNSRRGCGWMKCLITTTVYSINSNHIERV